LWRLSGAQEAALRADWEDHASAIACGRVDEITGYDGRYLQVRPKAADSRARRQAFDDDGGLSRVLPRGFYLRPSFTQQLLEEHFVLP
jgi:DNA mismatch repair protein MutH